MAEIEVSPDKVYRLDAVRLLKRLVPVGLIVLFMLAYLISYDAALTVNLSSKLIQTGLFGWLLVFFIMHEYVTFRYYQIHKNVCLEFLNGGDSFWFGYPNNMVEYKRSEVVEIIVYGVWGKGPSILNIGEVIFTEGRKIRVPYLLIDASILIQHLNKSQVNYFSTSQYYVPAISNYAEVPAWFVKLLYLAKK